MKLYQMRWYFVTRHDCEVNFNEILRTRTSSYALHDGFRSNGDELRFSEQPRIEYIHDFIGVHGMLEMMRRVYKDAPKVSQQLNVDQFVYLKTLNKTRYLRYRDQVRQSDFGASVLHILNAKYHEWKIDTVYHFFLNFMSTKIFAIHPQTQYDQDTVIDWIYDAAFPNRRTFFKKEWRTSNVVGIARGIFDDEKFDRMPILADALEDAGCDNDLVLNHLRVFKNFTRANWALSYILNKRRFK